jgi:hypothetical protein
MRTLRAFKLSLLGPRPGKLDKDRAKNSKVAWRHSRPKPPTGQAAEISNSFFESSRQPLNIITGLLASPLRH